MTTCPDWDRDFERVPISALNIGDIVWAHGMRLRLVSGGLVRHTSASATGLPVYSFRAIVLNPDKVREDKIVPWGWLIDNPEREPQWVVQSNDRCRWLREVPVP